MKVLLRSGYYNQYKNTHLSYTKGQVKQLFSTKKIYLFGGGNGADYFIAHYAHQCKIKGIIDNNVDLQGTNYQALAKNGWTKFPILGVDSLKKEDFMKEGNSIIIITSLRFSQEIASQLDTMGILDYAILSVIEKSKFFPYFWKGYDQLRKKYDTLYSAIGMKLTGNNAQDRKLKKQYKQYRHETIQNNKLVVYDNRVYNEHTKYIVEYMIKYKLPIEVVWIAESKSESFPKEVRIVLLTQIKQVMYEMATAKIWLSAFMMNPNFTKKKGQYYINTNHWSSVTFKKFYYDDLNCIKDRTNLKYIKWASKNLDYLMVGSEFDKQTCLSGYKTKAECVFIGSPRTDILFELSKEEGLAKNRQELKGHKVILYVPTFRRGVIKGEEELILDLDLLSFLTIAENYYKMPCKVLLKLHPDLRKFSTKVTTMDKILDVSTVEDVQELILVADIIITDYSSVMFEPMYRNKPVFLFATDIKEYMEKERGFFFTFEELPFLVAQDMQELEINMKKFKQEVYEEKVKQFLKKVDVKEDGLASKRAVEFISQLMNQ